MGAELPFRPASKPRSSSNSTGHLLTNCTGCSASGAITSWAGGTLGAMSNYGTSPGAVLVPGMNANVTGGAITANAGTNLNTSLLATDAHLTALGTSALGTDSHLTAFTSANHTDLGTLHTDLTTLNSSPVTLGSATGGLTPKLLNALSDSGVAVKSGAGQLYTAQCWNPNAAVAYLQVYDATSITGTPKLSIPIAPTATGGFALSLVGVQFATGIEVQASTTATTSSAPSTALDCNALYN